MDSIINANQKDVKVYLWLALENVNVLFFNSQVTTMKKDTRNSAGRVASYSTKMKEKGYKQVSFYLSPKAYATLTEMTLNERLLGSSLVGTNNRLLECLSGNEFVYEALKGLGNPQEAFAAIELTIKMFSDRLEEEKRRISEIQDEVEFMVKQGLIESPAA